MADYQKIRIRALLVVLVVALMAVPAASKYVPYGAPADVPPLKQILKEGGNASGSINMSFHKIRSLDPPMADRDAATKGYVDYQIIAKTSDDQNLSEVLGQGNNADDSDIDLNGNSLKSSGGEICIGNECS